VAYFVRLNCELKPRSFGHSAMRSLNIVASIFLLAFPSLSLAQTVGATIRGTIASSSGVRQESVQITLVSEETKERRQAASGPEGDFTLSVIPAGTYRLEAELGGFRKYVRRGVTLQIGQEVRINIVLEPGAPAEELVITATPALVNHDSAQVGTVIENHQIVNLPLDGRNFLQLSLLVPGTAPSAQGSPGSVRGEFTVNVNGAREDANNYLLDGVFNTDPKLNSFAINPPVDGIREFEILTSTYDASFGRSGGAQISVALKSGTNRFHGAVYEFFRNSVLDARNFFARAEDGDPQYQRHQFGASLGGPIRRNRTFFFADYEGRRVREGITRATNVPTASERSGDFSQSIFPRPLDPFTQQPFPNGQIPAGRLNPTGSAIAALYPLPNRPVPGQNFVSSPALRDRDDRFDVRVDHSLSNSSNLITRYSLSDRDLYEPFSGPTFSRVPGFGTNVPRRAQNAMVGENHYFSANLVNEARFAYSRVALGSFQENMGTSINRRVGLPDLSSNPRDFGLSFITISGFSPLGDEFNNPQHSVTNLFQALDTVTHVKGRHLIKAGVDYRSLQQNAFRDVQARGFLTFSDFGQVTGNALADLLLGFVTFSGGARLDNHQHLRTESWNVFLQDSYRARRNLTFLFGMRYEYNSPPVDRFDRANVYDPITHTLVPVGEGGIPRSGYEPDRNNWGPRFGLAWAPGTSEDTVLHAGYGVYFDQSSLAPGEGLYFNQPYFDLNLYFPLPGLPLTVNDPFPSFYPFALPPSALGFQRDLRTSYFQQWNFKLQRQVGNNRVAELAYVGSKGTKVLSGRDINQPPASPQQPNLRPVPQFADITFEESRGGSSYHSFQGRFQQRFQSGFSALASYTLGKSLDDSSTFFASFGDPNFPQDSLNLAAEKGRSNFDVRQRFSLSYSYEFPSARGGSSTSTGFLPFLLSGWATHGIITLQTGRPFTVALLSEIDRSNTGRSNLGFGANDRPNRRADGKFSDPQPEQWFDTQAFALPPFGNFGSSGRNILDGPGYKDVTLSLTKDTSLREELRLQFRAEFFNLFNHVNFDLPDIFLGSPTFGRVSSAQSPRRIQFGLKLLF
jgi:Carboxypeptidase regulatory-like domain